MSSEDEDDSYDGENERLSRSDARRKEEEDLAQAIALSIAEEQQRKELMNELFDQLNDDADLEGKEKGFPKAENVDSPIVHNVKYDAVNYGRRFHSRFKQLYNNPQLSDVILSLGGYERIPAHSLVLTSSPLLHVELEEMGPPWNQSTTISNELELPKTGRKRKREKDQKEVGRDQMCTDEQDNSSSSDKESVEGDVDLQPLPLPASPPVRKYSHDDSETIELLTPRGQHKRAKTEKDKVEESDTSTTTKMTEEMFLHPVQRVSVSPRGEKVLEISLAKEEVEVFKLMLYYMYTGTISVSAKDVESLLNLCNKFSVWELKDDLGTQLAQDISRKTLELYFGWAEKYSCSLLRTSCITFMAQHFHTLVQAGKLFDLDVDVWCQLLKSDDLHVWNEEDVFICVLEYVTKFEGKQKDEALEALLPHIRWPLMTGQFLVERVELNPAVNHLPLLKSLLYETYRFRSCKNGTTYLTTKLRKHTRLSFSLASSSDRHGRHSSNRANRIKAEGPVPTWRYSSKDIDDLRPSRREREKNRERERERDRGSARDSARGKNRFTNPLSATFPSPSPFPSSSISNDASVQRRKRGEALVSAAYTPSSATFPSSFSASSSGFASARNMARPTPTPTPPPNTTSKPLGPMWPSVQRK